MSQVTTVFDTKENVIKRHKQMSLNLLRGVKVSQEDMEKLLSDAVYRLQHE